MITLPGAQKAAPHVPVRVYPPPIRLVGASLFFVSRISVFAILVMLVFGIAGPVTPPRLARLLLFWVLLPAGALVLLRQVFAARLQILGDRITLHRVGIFRQRSVESLAVIQGSELVPWRLPVPAAGFALFAGNSAKSVAIETWAPGAITKAYASAGGRVKATPAARATTAYADARDAAGRMRWPHYVLKFVIFPMLPAFIFFRLHQWVMYGGFLGQYYLHGLQPWLSSLVFHWIMSCAYLLLYASLWRGPAELIAYITAARSPEQALQARRWVERVLAVLYYGGVPLLIALRFLA